MSDREIVQDCVDRGVPIPPGRYRLDGPIRAAQIVLSPGAVLVGSAP